jgi:hypothetical protein
MTFKARLHHMLGLEGVFPLFNHFFLQMSLGFESFIILPERLLDTHQINISEMELILFAFVSVEFVTAKDF